MPKYGAGRARWKPNFNAAFSTPEPAIVTARTIAARRHLQIQKITTVATNRHARTATDPRSVKNRMIAVSDGDARAWIRSLAYASKRAVSLSRTSSDSHPSRIAAPLARVSPAAATVVKALVRGETISDFA